MSSLFFENPLDGSLLHKREQPRNEDGKDLRGFYFRDTTAIIHSFPFRRLKHKTQVFFSPKSDHICTRIEHVMHVATIAATICRALDLDPDLAWAIGLGHDLGHAPFGHVGESIFSGILSERGGFRHEIYSLRVVDSLINYGKGLNLTYAVRDGIINHCGEKFEQNIEPDFSNKDLKTITTREFYPSTWEGCVVRMSDKIAYLGRDLEDAWQLKFVKKQDVPEVVFEVLGRSNGEIIDTLVNDLINQSLKKGVIGFSDKVYQAVLVLRKFNYQKIYGNPLLSNYHGYFERIIRTLISYLEKLYDTYALDYQAYKQEMNVLAVRFGDYLRKMKTFYETVDGSYDNLVIDYVAGMTDDYAIESISEIMIPKKFETQFEQILMNE